MLQKRDMKIKGIFIFLSFQIKKFGESEKSIIKKIINLIPIKDLWKYITIIITHFFSDFPDELELEKNNFKEELKIIFEKEFLPLSREKYGIFGNFNDINIVFTNFNKRNPSIGEAKEIKNIMENSSNKDPLFKCSKMIYEDNVKVIEYVDKDNGSLNLYNCKIKKITYYGQNEEILNEIRIIEEKDLIRNIKISELNSKWAINTFVASFGIGFLALFGLAFPPLEIASLVTFFIGIPTGFISEIVAAYQGYNYNSILSQEEIHSFIDESNKKT